MVLNIPTLDPIKDQEHLKAIEELFTPNARAELDINILSVNALNFSKELSIDFAYSVLLSYENPKDVSTYQKILMTNFFEEGFIEFTSDISFSKYHQVAIITLIG